MGIEEGILNSSRTIAVVGLSPKPERPSYRVASYLKEQGYKIIQKMKILKADKLHLQLLEAKYYISTNNFASAETILDVLKEKYPEGIEVHLMLSQLYEAEGNVREMVDQIEKVVELDKDFEFLKARSVEILDELMAERILVKKISKKKKIQKDKTVMIVDDDANFRKYSRILLEEEGYDVIQFRDGIECQKYLEGHSVDLVVLDVVLPMINGYEIAQTLIKKGYSMPIIFISGIHRKERYRNFAFSLGVDEFFIKPIDKEKFCACINRLTSKNMESLKKKRKSRTSRKK